MPTPLRRRLRIARRSVAYSAALLLVLVAVVLGTASQLLPLVDRNPDRVAAWLTGRAGRPVSFDRVETAWTRRGPLLKLAGLRVGEGDRSFAVGDTEMLVSIYAGLLPGTALSELRLRGLDLTLERASDGRWQVRGLPGQQQPGSDPLSALEGLGELQVIGGKLTVVSPAQGIHARLPKVHLRLRVDGDRVQVGARAWPAEGASPVQVALDFDRRRGDGRAHAVLRRADLAAWAPLLRAQGVVVEGGRGRAEAWAALHANRIDGITVDADLADVALRGTPLQPGTATPRSRFPKVQALARWQRVPTGWRIDAPRLRIGSGRGQQTLDGLLLAGGTHFALQAAHVDAGPLLSTLALSDRVPAGLRGWLLAARPRAALYGVVLAGRRGGGLQARGRVADVAFLPVGRSPGLAGLGGTMAGDRSGFSFEFDPDADVRFEWPAGFGVPHTVRLRGKVAGWRDGAGWRIGTPALRLVGRDGDGRDLPANDGSPIGQDFAVDARGSLWWQGDGSRPRIDLAAEVADTALPVAKGFWLRNDMPAQAVQWLDTALEGGTLHEGRAVISGDLDDWPFRDGTGVFDATGRIRDATLRFDPGWPPAQDMALDLHFTGTGFEARGAGRLGEVGIDDVRAGIDDYRDGALTVQATGRGDAARLLDILRNSPLRRDHAETFANVRASGPAGVEFGLDLPLHGGAAMAIEGAVALRNARLADPRWKLAFDQVTGTARYSREGFRAEDLSVRHESEPGRLSLRAGERFVRDPAHAFEAALQARFAAKALIGRAGDLDWLAPYLRGRSSWTVGLAIPRATPSAGRSPAGAIPPARLHLQSDLVGTALDLPAPLRKPAATALAARIEAPLPLGSGEVQVGLGDVMALRARSANGRTGVRVALGQGHLGEPAPASGLIASGRADALEVADWIALTRGGEGGGATLPLQRIDVTARRLQLLGGTFPDTRVLVVPAAAGATAVRAEGPRLEGSVLIPAGEGGAIAGRFERAHWRPVAAPAANEAVGATPGGPGSSPGPGATAAATPATAPTAGAMAAAAPAAELDPARIPALDITVADLRLADAALGSATIRTRPTADGMRFEQLRTRSQLQRIDVSGLWRGRGAAATTRLKVDIDSDDLGSLLGGFGLPGRLGGGEGQVGFDAAWPGSPMGFRLDGLEGHLRLDARDGRLLEVEPGAGRVLGLLSLAQLPRRLTLDFRDFFSKGFAFDEIKGVVRFENGQARSDGLSIDGPAAAIDIRGAADLRAQRYDQTIEVRPKAANLLTAIGAVAGGPMGAAIGAAANVVLSKPLGSLAAKTYRVTGPWKEPRVEVISREEGRAAAPVAPPAG